MEKLHMQYDVIMKLNFYDFENILESYSRILKSRSEEEEKRRAEEESKYSPNDMMRQATSNMKMPKIPGLPNVQIPHF